MKPRKLTPAAHKRLTLAIWTSERFQGSRDDAKAIAERQASTESDLFAEVWFETADEPPIEPINPNQCTLEF